MKPENKIQNEIQHQCNSSSCKLWRNNIGVCFQAPKHLRHQSTETVRYGLCNGSSDLIGYKVVDITPDMVGKQVAVFTAIEVKTLRGRASDLQDKFIQQVKQDGGLAGIARSVTEAKEIIGG